MGHIYLIGKKDQDVCEAFVVTQIELYQAVGILLFKSIHLCEDIIYGIN